MLRHLLSTRRDPTLLGLRAALAAVIFPQGAQKLLGWYGGFGLDGTMAFFASIGVPAPLALLVIASDFFGSLLLLLGLFGRVAAFGALSVMLGAMALVHGQYGFLLNWYGTQQGEGVQFHVLAAAVAATLVIKGSGAWSLDRLLSRDSAAVTSPASVKPRALKAA